MKEGNKRGHYKEYDKKASEKINEELKMITSYFLQYKQAPKCYNNLLNFSFFTDIINHDLSLKRIYFYINFLKYMTIVNRGI